MSWTMHYSTRIAAPITLGAGALSLAGWFTDIRFLASWGPYYIPMAPVTSINFILAGISLFLCERFPQNRVAKKIAVYAATIMFSFSCLKLLEFFTPLRTGIEEHLIRNPGSFGSVLLARMSPITASFFLICSVALLLLLNAQIARTRTIAAWLAILVMAADGVVLLGYLYASPMLYGGKVIPVAFTTAVAFIAWTSGLIWTAGRDCFPLRFFVGPSTKAHLMRAFMPVPFLFVLLNGLFHQMFPMRWNPALLAALAGCITGGLLALVISRIAQTVGGSIDRAEEAVRIAEVGVLNAYDTTLEGWARALDLRDKITEGHCRRVSAMTVRLARSFGLPEETLIHIRRGALLHDIGKMGLPDSVLLKPGPLTPEEWQTMRQHPALALRMLGHIEYLRPALEIPYCHHERWDGTGYPRGLAGEEIPLAARLFSIVDIWDALIFERPYHKPWPKEKVCDYIRSLSGKNLEPRVVDAFFLMLERDSNAVPAKNHTDIAA